MKRCLLINSILVVLLAISSVSCSATDSPSVASHNSTPDTTSIPMSTSLATSKTAAESIPEVANYYQAIKAKNYALAYTFLDANAKDSSGQILSEASFKQMALASDSDNGAIVNVEIDPASDNSMQIILTIDRSSSLHYHAHLTMKQEGQSWKIISLDRI